MWAGRRGGRGGGQRSGGVGRLAVKGRGCGRGEGESLPVLSSVSSCVGRHTGGFLPCPSMSGSAAARLRASYEAGLYDIAQEKGPAVRLGRLRSCGAGVERGVIAG